MIKKLIDNLQKLILLFHDDAIYFLVLNKDINIINFIPKIMNGNLKKSMLVEALTSYFISYKFLKSA